MISQGEDKIKGKKQQDLKAFSPIRLIFQNDNLIIAQQLPIHIRKWCKKNPNLVPDIEVDESKKMWNCDQCDFSHILSKNLETHKKKAHGPRSKTKVFSSFEF